MSHYQTFSDQTRPVRTPPSGRRRASGDEQRRMTSINRRLHWYLIRGKILRFLGADLLLLVLLPVCWCASQEYAAAGTILFDCERALTTVRTAAEPGFDLIYRVWTASGSGLLSVSCLRPACASVSPLRLTAARRFTLCNQYFTSSASLYTGPSVC